MSEESITEKEENVHTILDDLKAEMAALGIEFNDILTGKRSNKRVNRGARMKQLQMKEVKDEALGYFNVENESDEEFEKSQNSLSKDSFDSDFFDVISDEIGPSEKKPLKRIKFVKNDGSNKNVTIRKDENQEIFIEIRKLIELHQERGTTAKDTSSSIKKLKEQDIFYDDSQDLLKRKRKPNLLVSRFKPTRERIIKTKETSERTFEQKRSYKVEEKTQEDLLFQSIYTEMFNIKSLEEMQKLEELNKKENYTSGIKKFVDYVRSNISKGIWLTRSKRKLHSLL